MDNIKLSEKIHFVIQGEGVNTNKKMLLLRTLGCPIKCIGCDSEYTWKKGHVEEVHDFSANALAERLKYYSNKFNVKHIMLTGGEPHIYIEQIMEMFKILMPRLVWKWDIETTGYESWRRLNWFWHNIQFNFSPKIGILKSKKNWEWKGLYPSERPPNYIVKIVSSQASWDEDLIHIKMFQEQYQIPSEKIYIMPMGTTSPEIISESKFLIDKVWEKGFEFSSRQHILIYNDKKQV